LKTWTPLFADEVFPNINEGRFSVLAAKMPPHARQRDCRLVDPEGGFQLSDDELLDLL
jgi:hypothetical protein